MGQLDLGHVHQGIHFVFGAFEVLDAKRIYRDMCNASFIADFENLPPGSFLVLTMSLLSAYPGKGFKSKMMPFNSFYPVTPSVSAVPVHHEGDVSGDWTLS